MNVKCIIKTKKKTKNYTIKRETNEEINVSFFIRSNVNASLIRKIIMNTIIVKQIKYKEFTFTLRRL